MPAAAKVIIAQSSATFGSASTFKSVKQLLVLAAKPVTGATAAGAGALQVDLRAACVANAVKPALAGTSSALPDWTAMTRPVVDGDVPMAHYWFKSPAAESGDVNLTLSHWCDKRSRNAGIVRADSAAALVSKNLCKTGDVQIIVGCGSSTMFSALTSAIAALFPLYNTKTGKTDEAAEMARTIYVDFVTPEGASVDYASLQRLADAVRVCARWVDMPASELHTDSYVDEVTERAAKLAPSVTTTVIRGEQLRDQGFGGLWGVGKGAEHLPALVVLSHRPACATHTTAWVGKGIVFDTGGLSIKGSANMCTMKCDMGGSAAIYAAFEAAVKGGYKQNLHAVLCIAENSVSAKSTRPDDILYMYSGKTVEINNTDAEGRLVLGDGVAYATRHLSPDVLLDMATLTGAQGIATGQKHAAILCNDEMIEKLGFAAGQTSGDLTYPILYAPELLMKEFDSDVADMKNSVKNRANAQSSCAGHFIESHFDSEFKGHWIHVDIAAPAHKDSRATGFGVAFLLQLLNDVQSCASATK